MNDKPVVEWLRSDTVKVEMGSRCGSFYVIRNYNPCGKIVSISVQAGKLKAGACGITLLNTVADLINSKLEHNASLKHICDKYLIGKLCQEDNRHIVDGGLSCIDAIGKKLTEVTEVDTHDTLV